MTELTGEALYKRLADDYVVLLRSVEFQIKDDKCMSDNLYEWIVELVCDFRCLTTHGRVPKSSLMISGASDTAKTCILEFIRQVITRPVMSTVPVTEGLDVYFRSPNVIACLNNHADCQAGYHLLQKYLQVPCEGRLKRMVSSHDQHVTCLLKAYESKISYKGYFTRLQSQDLVAWLHLEDDRMERVRQLLMVQSIACNATRACIMRHLVARIMAKAHWQRLRHMWQLRCVAFYWLGLKETRSCAPGGAGRAADTRAFEDEWNPRQ